MCLFPSIRNVSKEVRQLELKVKLPKSRTFKDFFTLGSLTLNFLKSPLVCNTHTGKRVYDIAY